MNEKDNENSAQAWLRLGVEVGKLAGEMGSRAVKAVFGEAEYIDPPVRLWYGGKVELYEELSELGLTPEEIARHERFKRQIKPRLENTLKPGD